MSVIGNDGRYWIAGCLAYKGKLLAVVRLVLVSPSNHSEHISYGFVYPSILADHCQMVLCIYR